MKVTAIKQQLKRPDRYSIYVDGRYSFSFSETALLRCELAPGDELSDQQLNEYKQRSADDKQYGRALRYVAMRQRSIWEVRDYLRRKDCPLDVVDEIIGRLQDLRLLDDARYAESFARDRQLLRPTSMRRLKLELKKKRISEEHIATALDSLEVDEMQSIHKVIAKKRRQARYQDDNRLMQYLARQGFSYTDIKAALSQDDDY